MLRLLTLFAVAFAEDTMRENPEDAPNILEQVIADLYFPPEVVDKSLYVGKTVTKKA